MKRILNTLLFLLLAGGIFFFPLSTSAKINTVDSDYSYVIPSEYAFTPKFIKGVTKVQMSDSYKGSQITITRKQGYNNYWILYKNVGIWRHHIVDMKITLDDVVDTDATTKCTASGGYADVPDKDMITFYFYSDELAIRVDTMCRSAGTMGIFKVEFFDNQTGEALSDLKSVLTYDDIDSQEQIAFDNNNAKEQFYYSPYGVEHLSLLQNNFENTYTLFKGNNNWTCRSNGNFGDVNCFKNSSIVEAGSCYRGDCEGCYKAGMMTVLNEGNFTLGWSGYYTGFSATGFLRIGDPGPMKFVDKEEVKPGEDIHYTIEQYVPNQATKHYYKSWKIIDRLNSALEIKADDITITSDGEVDVTSMFDIDITNNILTVSVKADYLVLDEIYNRTFIINIKSKVMGNIKDVKEIKNQATLNIEYSNGTSSEDILSNEVKTTIEYPMIEEILEVPNTDKFINKVIYILGVIFILGGIFTVLKIRKKKTGN